MTGTTSKIIRNRTLGLTMLLTVLFCGTTSSALAVQWTPLARTAQYDVAIDSDSVRLTSLSRLAVWLRFTPLSEQQRRQAAADQGQKSYRLHLEFYEIDCSEQSAVLALVDILGPAGKRLARTKGDALPELIVPGSALDLAARMVCPELEEQAVFSEDEPDPAENSPVPLEPEEKQVTEATRQNIAIALQKTVSTPKEIDAWRELGNAYFDAGMPSEAIAAYSRALEINPKDTNILNDQGAMYRETGDFTSALANFEKARKADPANLESIYNSGYVLAFDLNQIDKAIVVWRSYLKLDKESETSRQVQSFIERYGIPTVTNVKK